MFAIVARDRPVYELDLGLKAPRGEDAARLAQLLHASLDMVDLAVYSNPATCVEHSERAKAATPNAAAFAPHLHRARASPAPTPHTIRPRADTSRSSTASSSSLFRRT